MGALDRIGLETTPDMADGGQILPVKEVGMAAGGYLDPGYDMDVVRRAPDSPLDAATTSMTPQREVDLAPRRKPREEGVAEAKPIKMSLRERHAQAMQDFLREKGIDNYNAARIAQSVIGGPRSGAPFGLGLADVPLVTPYTAEEAGYTLGEGVEDFRQRDYLSGLGNVGLAGLYALPLAKPAVVTAKAAGRALGPKAAEMAESYMQKAGLMPSVIKPKGGNWLTGSVEKATDPLKKGTIAGQTPAERIPLHEALLKDPSLNADQLDRVRHQLEVTRGEAALNNWIDQKLNKYIRNEMATPEDPVRKLAEQGRLHFEAPYVEPTSKVDENRRLFAKENNGKWGYGQNQLAQNWEDAADRMLNVVSAESIQSMNPATFNRNWPGMEWVHKLNPETPLYGLNRGVSGAAGRDPSIESLGFDHLIDELRNATRPDSDLPANLRWKPEDLKKVTMEQAVERVAKINEWRAAKKAEANEALARNPATAPYKDYQTVPGTQETNKSGLAWKQIKAPEFKSVEQMTPEAQAKYQQYMNTGAGEEASLRQAAKHDKSLANALKYEGEVMGHCVGGYCDDVLSGKSQIFSLRDKKGEPHVTIEVAPIKRELPEREVPLEVTQELKDIAEKEARAIGEANGLSPWSDEVVLLASEKYHSALYDWRIKNPQVTSNIIQIKGKANRAPKEEYLPFVQDFVRSGNWGEVRDLQNTGLIPIDPKSDIAAAFSKLGKPVPSYVTQDELTNLLKWHRGEGELPQGFAKGGLVQDADAIHKRLMATGMPHEQALTQALKMAQAKEEAHMAAGGLVPEVLSKIKTIGNYKALPLVLPRAPAKTAQEIADIAERVGRQQAGEHVRKPAKTVNLAGRSGKEVEKLQKTAYTLEPTKTPALETVVPEKSGQIRIALPGDISVADKVLLDVEGLPIGSVQEGGALYGAGYAHLQDPAFWASGPGPAQIFQNKVTDLANLYQTPEILAQHMAMGHDAMNFAQHFADANLLAIQASMPHPKAVDRFNKIIREGFVKKDPDTGKKIRFAFPNFPGVENYEEAYKATQADPELRKWFNERMKKGDVTEPLNFPDGKKIEYAIMEPALRNMEIGMSGLSVGRMKPGAELRPESPHRTYSHDILGTYMGKTPELTPTELAFPDALLHIRSTKSPSAVTPTIQKLFPHQVVDEQYINELGEYYDKLRKVRGFKEGGIVAPEGGEEFAKQVMQKMQAGGLLKKGAAKIASKAEPKVGWGVGEEEKYRNWVQRNEEQSQRMGEAWKRILEKPVNPPVELPPGVERLETPKNPISYAKGKEMSPEEFAKKSAEEAERWKRIGGIWKKNLEKPLEPWTPPQDTQNVFKAMEDSGLTYDQLKALRQR